jgi:D-alanyl-D-alanine carboxypeptidase
VVEDWLPGLLPRGQDITIRHLLSHYSGIFNYTNDAALIESSARTYGDLERYWSPQEIIAVANAHGMVFEPGAERGYSNTGYIVLGLIIEAATGTPVAEVIRTRILAPHALDDTYLAGAEPTPEVVHTYTTDRVDFGRLPTTSLTSTMWTAGAMVSTPRDLIRWARLLYTGDVLPAAALDEMLEGGLSVGAFTGSLGPGLSHDGVGPGSSAEVSYSSRAGVTLAWIVNQAGIDGASVGVALPQALASLVPTHPALFPGVPTTVALLLDEQVALASEGDNGGLPMRMAADQPVFSGSRSAAVTVASESFLGWSVTTELAPAIDPFGFATLHLAIHPGTLTGSAFNLKVGGSSIPLVGRRSDPAWNIDLTRAEWQVLEIPARAFFGSSYADTLVDFGFFGTVEGTFYVDDVRLLPGSTAALTAVVETGSPTATPAAFELHASYPNPFNGSATVRIDLATATDVDLAIYNLAGQRVATLARGTRGGGTHTFHWDARNDGGRPVGSGVYLVRLRTPATDETHELTLLR